MKPYFAISLALALTIGLSGCDSHGNFLDFISDPVQPPIAKPDSGTYGTTLHPYLDRGDENDSTLYYTLDPDISFTDLTTWNNYDTESPHGFDISKSTKMRVFSYVSATRYSEVKTISWELKCPKATFTPPSGTVSTSTILYINPPNDPSFNVYYHITTDGSDPNDGTLPSFAAGGSTSNNMTHVSSYQPRVRVYAITRRAGWSDSDPAVLDISYVAPVASSISAIPAARVAR